VGGFGAPPVLLVTDTVVLGWAWPGLTDALAASGTSWCSTASRRMRPWRWWRPASRIYQAEDCDALVAFGGGSVMDAAKAIGLCGGNDKHPRELVGYFRGRHGPPPLYAVPTTAGTGSEVTVAAVISDPANTARW
jgi:alcohol dehydrogenase